MRFIYQYVIDLFEIELESIHSACELNLRSELIYFLTINN